jgi:hypothetical protein
MVKCGVLFEVRTEFSKKYSCELRLKRVKILILDLLGETGMPEQPALERNSA